MTYGSGIQNQTDVRRNEIYVTNCYIHLKIKGRIYVMVL
jgi:hypothetical protein